MIFLGIWGDNIKHVGNSILNRIDDKFKSVFRILIAKTIGMFG